MRHATVGHASERDLFYLVEGNSSHATLGGVAR